MDSRTGRNIDVVINKKLGKGLVGKSPKSTLIKFINYSVVREYDAIKHASLISELVNVNPLIIQKDVYNNEVCNFLDYTVSKSKTSFNLLRLFKPGEILNAVMSV